MADPIKSFSDEAAARILDSLNLIFKDVFEQIAELRKQIERGTKIRSSNHEALSSRVKALEEQLAELAELVPAAKPAAAAQCPRNFGVDYGDVGKDYTAYTFVDGLNPKVVQSVREHFGKIGLPVATTTKIPDNKGGEFAYFHPSQLQNGYPGLPIVCFDDRGDRHELIGWFSDLRPISRWVAWQDWMEIERPTHGKPALMELAGYLIRRNHEMRKSSPVATPKQETIPPFPYAGPKRPVADKLQGEIQLCCKQHDFVVRQGQAFCNKCGLGAEDSPHDFEQAGNGYMKCKKCFRLETFVGNYGSMGTGCTGQLPQPVRGTTEKPVEKTVPAVKFSSPEAVCAGIGHQMVLRNSNDGSKLVCSRCGHVRSETRGDVTVNRGPDGPSIVAKLPDEEAKPAVLVGPSGKPCQLHNFITLEGLAACAVCGMRFEDFVKAANTATKPA